VMMVCPNCWGFFSFLAFCLSLSCVSHIVVPVTTTTTTEDNQLKGSLPSELFFLAQLTGLTLSGGDLDGTLAPMLYQLTNLVDLNLSFNLLSGSIPSELGSSLTNLDTLALQGNQFTGSIPLEFSRLESATNIQLQDNPILTGSLDLYCTLTLVQLSADCGGASPTVICPCCDKCCDPDSGNCVLTVWGACKLDQQRFETPSSNDNDNDTDNSWYQQGAGTTCSCVGTGEGATFQANSLVCTDTTCQSCTLDGSKCSVNQDYGFGYNSNGIRTDYTVTFQYQGVNKDAVLVLEKRYFSNGDSSTAVFVNGLFCATAGEEQCAATNDDDALKGYFADCNTSFLTAGSFDLCAATQPDDIMTGPLAVFALQDPALLQGCPPRFPPL
jgi:hypothetical protein